MLVSVLPREAEQPMNFTESVRNGSVCTEDMVLSEHHMSYYNAGRCSSPAWGPTVPMEKLENRKNHLYVCVFFLS